MAHCDGCGTDEAIVTRTTISGNNLIRSCDICSSVRAGDAGLPDVYIGGKGGLQTCENLCDPKTGNPIPFSSKKEKAAIMKNLHLTQHPSSERRHGYRNEKYLKKRIYG